MYNGFDRRRSQREVVGVRNRQIAAQLHDGTADDFLRRYGRECHEIATANRRKRQQFAANLFDRMTDERNIRCAIAKSLAQGETAPGPNGVSLRSLDSAELWQLARNLRDALRNGSFHPGPSRQVEIRKASGGTRTIAVQNVEDNVVQRALAQTIQPFLDPIFEERALGFRPGRNRECALALVEQTMANTGRTVWLTDDLRDAFDNVPHRRLLDIQHAHGLPDNLIELIEEMIRNNERRGIPQGSPLSPLLLNTYLDRTLDKPWKRRLPNTPLLRFADDLLVLCETREEASAMHEELRRLTNAAGMPLKGGTKTAIQDLQEGESIEWLGLQIQGPPRGLEASIARNSWIQLEDRLQEAQAKPDAPIRGWQTLCGWVDQLGPVWAQLNEEEFLARVQRIAVQQACEEISTEDLRHSGRKAEARWQAVRRTVQLGHLSGFAGGSAHQHREIGNCRSVGASAPTPLTHSDADVILFCDGSYVSTTRAGGWAYIRESRTGGTYCVESGCELRTTNNRMELTAVIRGLESLDRPARVHVVTDSQYVFHGITRDLERWSGQGWRAGSPGRLRALANRALWQRFDELVNRHHVTAERVRGHSGHARNEEVDQLARAAAESAAASPSAACEADDRF